ncbi:MAG: ATP-dependent helicase HrpB [Gemmatimonadales bacterium]|nr:MAG: ATP-dependent helicase HrpB [Gemmatimonadales bacterium]
MRSPSPRRPPLPELPIRELLDLLAERLSSGRRAVVVAPPGAGKTTLIPLALLDAPWLEGRTILMLEPRRLAARAAARRMSTLLGEDDAGGTVGYRVRLDTRVSDRTRIEVVTEGVLTRMLHSDPALPEVGVVLFDEFHERSLQADLGLALTLESADVLRPDLRIVVMSATLEAEPVAELLGGAPVLTSEGRAYPVETRWRARPVDGWIEPAAVRAILESLERDEGDLLVFLPGAGEIRRTRDRLAESDLPAGTRVHTLHGSLSRDDQDAAVRPAPPGTRKVVLASAIAESSLTIEGTRVVIDSGLMRVPRFDPGSAMSRLETVRVSRDSADQRRGRAGRETPGVCYRLWTRAEDRGLVPTRTPEILEADLAPLALELAVWGSPPEQLRWLDPPPEGGLAAAIELLGDLELLEPSGTATEHGRRVAGLGLHPRLGHMLLRAQAMGRGQLACELAAILGDRDLVRAQGRAADADLTHRVELLRGHRRAVPRGHTIDRGALARARRELRHWQRRLPGRPTGGSPDDLADVGVLAALAYPDRVGRRREGERGRFLLRNGRGARFTESQSLEGAEWLVAVELDGRGREARIFRAAGLEADEIEAHFGPLITTDEEVAWDPESRQVRARTVRRLGAIELSEGPLGQPDPQAALAALFEGIREMGVDSLGWSREVAQLRDRLTFLHRLAPEQWPDRSDAPLLAGLEEWLAPFLISSRRTPRRPDDVPNDALREGLLSGIAWEDRARLDDLAPTHLEVPSGSRLPLDYADPDAPALAVRIQEVFGLPETPRIGGGRVPVTLRLLSPAQRPVQVTRDLANFWAETYFEVRKDLRGRYPKHFWPDDPLDAPATRRTRPRS